MSSHSPALLLFARQRARLEADAQDLVQEAVVECWKRHAIAGPPPLAMVFATIRRRAMDLARGQDRRAGREAAACVEAPPCWFDSRLEDRERHAIIQRAMGQLPDIYRDVITLKIWGGLTFVQIGEALEVPANTAASRYRYGMAELRKLAREVLA